ncbi:murein biosynthesis integral membrane protein MurJ [Pimelobacter sp. 30-1]|uniref:murein biosynthesis integral membrane protein MurJ n=1 Tax=Pimelobacter sp. 30-1 TaxID=2004991 RepID=UPI001C04A178|nr:murein biosynthesis integral membrane protein MurJ [Pimelobacter sp. 30-1]MBU2695628.1 murein biosynthesis integral membrane protein MurJ [Pimelobacter sp. 30-1]
MSGESTADAGEQRKILANTAVMAAGTVVSRLSGFVRLTLLAAALGVGLHADIFTVANTVPNMLYILLAGGVFNAVLVPQLVRSMKNDPDGGAAYVNRVITLAGLFLAVITVVLVIAAPLVMRLMLNSDYNEPELAAQRQSAIDFARYCLPQVFFYGMFVLVGQVLNARNRFGPMMWAPIANNVISVAVIGAYLWIYGPATAAQQRGAFSTDQELLLGIGSTVGIAAQLLILVPYLRAAGVRYRPRFDFRGVGLGHTLHLGVWTVLFVVANQLAYVVVVRLASGGSAGAEDGTGITVYSNVMLLVMVPHSVITVSLATAILPRLSAAAAVGDMGRLATTLGSTLRTALAVVVPFAALLPSIALPLAQVVWGHGASASTYYRFEAPMVLFGFAVVAFTVHYLVLRGFYALELNRLVFFVQCAVAATNITLALLFVARVDPWDTAPVLVLAYGGAYTVGAAVSTVVLVRRLRRGGAPSHVRSWLGYVGRLLGVAVLVWFVARFFDIVITDTVVELVGNDPHWAFAALEVAVVSIGGGGTLLAAARLLHLDEVTSVAGTVLGRLRRG